MPNTKGTMYLGSIPISGKVYLGATLLAGGGAPVNTALPAITGTLQEGQTLTVSDGTWTNSPTSYTRQWYRDGVAIGGATSATYLLAPADIGANITAQVSATNASGTANATSAAVGPIFYAMLTYNLLDSFDALGSRTANAGVVQSIAGPLVEGTGSLQAVLSGVQNPGLTNPNIGVNDAPTTWDVMAVLIDMGDVARGNPISACRPTITTNSTAYGYQVDSGVTGTVQPNFATFEARGRKWRSFPAKRLRLTNWAGVQFQTASAGSKQVSLGLQQLANGDHNSTVKVDALVRVQRHKPCIAITCDDVNVWQLTTYAPILQARGLFATGYASMGLFGSSPGVKLTLADAATLKNTYGWSWCLNSGRIDEALTGFATVAASIAQLNSHRDELIASGLGTAEDAKHVAASFGPVTYPQKPVTRSATGNGTTTVTVTGGVWSANISAGMVVKGTGLGTDPIVTNAQSNAAVTLDQALPSGSYSLTFCGHDLGLAVTCNGTTSVTVATAGLFVGQEMTGKDVPANTFITVLGSGVVTVSNAVPATCTRASFVHTNGEFGFNKLEDALITAGYKSLRKGVLIGGTYTGFGLDPKVAMNFPSFSLEEPTTSATIIANMQMAIDDAVDTIALHHVTASATAPHLEAVADFIQARQAAGDLDVVSVPELFRRASLRPGFA